MMITQIHVKLDVNQYNVTRIVFLGTIIFFFISPFNIMLLRTFETSRESLIRLRMPNAAEAGTFLSCSTPYDDNRCSVQSANRTDSKHCLTDVEAIAGHISPLVSFVMQVCLIRELFALTGKYSHIFVNILWLVSLFIFITVATAVHGSTCYHDYTTFIISLVGLLLGGFIMSLLVLNGPDRSTIENYIAIKHKNLTTTNHDPKIMIEITEIC
jgi:hypothetical protein